MTMASRMTDPSTHSRIHVDHSDGGENDRSSVEQRIRITQRARAGPTIEADLWLTGGIIASLGHRR